MEGGGGGGGGGQVHGRRVVEGCCSVLRWWGGGAAWSGTSCPKLLTHRSTPGPPLPPFPCCSSIPAPHVVATAELIFADGAGGVTDPSALIGPTLAGLGLHPQDSSVDVNEFTQALMQMVGVFAIHSMFQCTK